MKKYFFSDGKDKQGPFSLEELKNKDIKKETLIWFQGLEDWKPAEEIKEFEEILELIPPPIVADYIETNIEDSVADGMIEKIVNDVENQDDKCNNLLDTAPHPWRRLLARTADFFFGGYLMLIPISYAVGYFSPQSVDGYVELLENPIVVAFIAYLVWIPFEAMFISFMGTTPSKWIFGIRVISKTGEKLSFTNSLHRVFLVFVQGDGLAIPLVTLFTRISAYKRLTKTGTTLWDTSINSLVVYKSFGVIRVLSSIFVYLAMLVILTLLNSV